MIHGIVTDTDTLTTLVYSREYWSSLAHYTHNDDVKEDAKRNFKTVNTMGGTFDWRDMPRHIIELARDNASHAAYQDARAMRKRGTRASEIIAARAIALP